MIDQMKTARSLVDKINSFCIANSFTLIVDGESLIKDSDVIYIEEKLLNNKESSVGKNPTSSDIERPVYQLNIFTPRQFGKWKAGEIFNLLKVEFPKMTFVLNDGSQTVKIESLSSTPVIYPENHGVSFVSVNLTVIATNT